MQSSNLGKLAAIYLCAFLFLWISLRILFKL